MNNSEFPEIKTGNGIDRDLTATTNDRLKKVVIEINKLTKTIEIFNDQSSKQTNKMIWLTWGIVGLTLVMIFGICYQIYLAIPKNTICSQVLTDINAVQHCETTYHFFLGKEITIPYNRDSK